jgi:hypothetical protein
MDDGVRVEAVGALLGRRDSREIEAVRLDKAGFISTLFKHTSFSHLLATGKLLVEEMYFKGKPVFLTRLFKSNVTWIAYSATRYPPTPHLTAHSKFFMLDIAP